MEKYIETLQQAADRGDLAACAALVNYHGQTKIAEAFSAGFTVKFEPCDVNFCASDFDADNEQVADAPGEAPDVVIQEAPVGEGTPNPEPVAEAPAVAKPIRAGTKARTEL